MNIYYANGGGLGHLTRARAFLHQLRIEDETALLTASEFAGDKRIVGDLEIIEIDETFARNRTEYQQFLHRLFAERSVKKLFLDSFPAGLTGEFADLEFGGAQVFYIARRLRWKNYSPLITGTKPFFKKTFLLEPLEKKHLEFIENRSEEIVEFALEYPQFDTSDKAAAQKIIAAKTPFWLIVHAGNAEETGELRRFAEEMRAIEKAEVSLVLISPHRSLFRNSYDIYPASMLFPAAERIFTGGGFNAIRQTEEFRRKHVCLPFERRYDDQFARAGRLGARASEAPANTVINQS